MRCSVPSSSRAATSAIAQVLNAVAREAGLSGETLAAFANPVEGREQVAAEEQRLRGIGVVATPNLLINGRVLVPGPADVSTYIQALDQALFPGFDGCRRTSACSIEERRWRWPRRAAVTCRPQSEWQR